MDNKSHFRSHLFRNIEGVHKLLRITIVSDNPYIGSAKAELKFQCLKSSPHFSQNY